MNLQRFREHLKGRLEPKPIPNISWKLGESDYETIRVPKHCIPEGGRLVEAYETATEYIILGSPEDEPESPTVEWYEKAHNCDFMGCGTGSHVILRIKKKAD